MSKKCVLPTSNEVVKLAEQTNKKISEVAGLVGVYQDSFNTNDFPNKFELETLSYYDENVKELSKIGNEVAYIAYKKATQNTEKALKTFQKPYVRKDGKLKTLFRENASDSKYKELRTKIIKINQQRPDLKAEIVKILGETGKEVYWAVNIKPVSDKEGFERFIKSVKQIPTITAKPRTTDVKVEHSDDLDVVPEPLTDVDIANYYSSENLPKYDVKTDPNKLPVNKKYKKIKKPGESPTQLSLFSKIKERKEITNIEKESKSLKKLLPNVPIQIHRGLIGIEGGFAEGMFVNNMIVLSDVGNEGVAFHEAFHAVTQLYLTPEQRKNLYKIASKHYGRKSESELEEDLAEDFREYMIKKGDFKTIHPFVKWLYDSLMNLVDLFRNDKTALFSKIRRGQFAYQAPFESAEVLFSTLPFPGTIYKRSSRWYNISCYKLYGITFI